MLETLYRSSSKVVFRARRQQDGRAVVLKCLDKPSVASRRRMEREVSFLRRLHGTGTIRLLGPRCSSLLLGVCSEVVDFSAEEGVIILGDDGGTLSC